MEEVVSLIFKTYGIVGVLILAPLVACIYLWKENKAITRESAKHIQAVNDRIVAAQNQRVTDAQAITNKLVELVSEQSSTNKETNMALAQLEAKLAALKRQ